MTWLVILNLTCMVVCLLLMYDPETTNDISSRLPNKDLEILCMSIMSKIVLPYRAKSSSKQMVIMFKTFKGYSDGNVDLTISQDPDCIGPNILHMFPVYGQCGNMGDNIWGDEAKNKLQNKACRTYWLANYNNLYSDPNKLEKCAFALDFALNSCTFPHKCRNVGSLQITVSGSVAYHHLTSPTSFTVTIEVDTVRDFPIDLSTEKSLVRLKLPTSKQTFFVKPENPFSEKSSPNGPIVKLNYSGVFQQFMLAIRIRILENVICPSLKDVHPLDAAHIYALDNNISDVYLARDYIICDSMVKLLNYTGYYLGSCRALVKGQTCSRTLSYNVMRIHHLPSIIVAGAQNIAISTKRTDD